MYNEIIKDRIEAGLMLSDKLMHYKNSNAVILAIPRGGVPIGYVISKSLNLPLDIILSKKIPHPYNKEFAIGAVSLDSTIVDQDSGVSNDYIEKEVFRLRELLKTRYEFYRGDHEPIDVKGKNVIIVDDGIATGHTLLASIAMLRKQNPAKIIAAVPVLPFETLKTFEQNTDELVYLIASKNFRGVGAFYEQFGQVDDRDVIRMLNIPNHIQ